MFTSIFAPFERLLASSRAQTNTASVKLDQAEDVQGATKGKGEIIDHLQIPPAKKEVPLSELLQASKRKPGIGDFEVVPRTKGVLVLDEGTESTGGEEGTEDWPHLASEPIASDKLVNDRVSYAQVTKASATLALS